MPVTTVPRASGYMQALAHRVRVLRHYHNKTQEDLAKDANVSTTTISHIEKGKVSSISLAHFMALVEALCTTPNILLGIESLRLDAQIHDWLAGGEQPQLALRSSRKG